MTRRLCVIVCRMLVSDRTCFAPCEDALYDIKLRLCIFNRKICGCGRPHWSTAAESGSTTCMKHAASARASPVPEACSSPEALQKAPLMGLGSSQSAPLLVLGLGQRVPLMDLGSPQKTPLTALGSPQKAPLMDLGSPPREPLAALGSPQTGQDLPVELLHLAVCLVQTVWGTGFATAACLHPAQDSQHSLTLS